MPAQSTLSNDEKTKVKSAVNSPANKILTAALARIYYAYPKPEEWSYSGLQGALAFVTDKSRNALFMKMVDLAGTRGIIWEHELYDGFEYFQDRPFFHSFAGDVSRRSLYGSVTPSDGLPSDHLGPCLRTCVSGSVAHAYRRSAHSVGTTFAYERNWQLVLLRGLKYVEMAR